MRKNKWVFMIVGVVLGMLIVSTSIAFVFKLIDVPVYPNISRPSSTEFGFVIDNCLYSSILGSGGRFHKDGSYFSKDKYEDIESWYEQIGWDKFSVKGSGSGVVDQSYLNIGKLQIQIWKRAQHLDTYGTGTIHIKTDSHLSFCWSDKTTK